MFWKAARLVEVEGLSRLTRGRGDAAGRRPFTTSMPTSTYAAAWTVIRRR
jgi:hypothetical protein